MDTKSSSKTSTAVVPKTGQAGPCCAIRDIERGDTDRLSCQDSRSTDSSQTTIEVPANDAVVSEKKHTETVTFDDGPIPDGGYSWVIVVCQFISQMATWGMVSPYGVFISWFISQNTYPGATATQFGWIGGILGTVVFGMSPLSNYISKLLPLKGRSLSRRAFIVPVLAC